VRAVREVIDLLEADGILSQCSIEDEGEGFRLGRPAEGIRIIDVLDAIRGPRGEIGAEVATASSRVIREMIGDLDHAIASYAASYTLADLLAKIPESVESRIPS